MHIPGRRRIREREPSGANIASLVDEELAGLSAADPNAFAELYERYVDGIYGYCFRRLGSREAAEDATSQVFSRALAAISRFQPRSTVRSWLFTIAHNIITDQFRVGAKVQEKAIDAHWDIVDDRSTVEEVIISNETRDMVRHLLTHLSTDQRRVIELRLADLTGPEIQTVLGRSRAWVNTTQFRAIQRLRTVLDETGGDPHV